MNVKRFVPGCLAVFVFIFVYEWIVHDKLLRGLYEQTPALWRTKAEMQERMVWLVGGQLALAVLLSYIFTKGYENRGPAEGVRYGVLMGLLMTAGNLIMYAVQPISLALLAAWTVVGLLETIVAGLILAAIYQPRAAAGAV